MPYNELLEQPQHWSWASIQYSLDALKSFGRFLTRHTIGDAYDAYMNPEEFLEKLHQRSWDSGTNVGIGFIGPSWQQYLPNFLRIIPEFVYVSGSSNGSFRAVAEYGELGAEIDPASRKVFAVVEKLLGQKTVNTLQGKEAMLQKKLLKTHFTEAMNSKEVFCFCLDTLSTLLRVNDIESFPLLINKLLFIIMGKCVFGINTDLNEKYILEFMEIAKLITNPWPSSAQLKAANERIRTISDELLENSLKSIDPSKYIAAHAQLDQLSADEEKLKKLKTENIAASFLANTNLADLIMKAIATIGNDKSIQDKLMDELQSNWENDLATLDQLPYLDLIYHEAQRLYSPSLIARRNSKSFTLTTHDEEKQIHTHVVPPHSYFFAPIRPRHLDPHLWDRPDEFIPERFEGEEGQQRKKMLVTFSDGIRSCPAKFGFTKCLFKTIVAGFFSLVKEFQLDKAIEQIPVFSINTSWKEDYKGTFTMR